MNKEILRNLFIITLFFALFPSEAHALYSRGYRGSSRTTSRRTISYRPRRSYSSYRYTAPKPPAPKPAPKPVVRYPAPSYPRTPPRRTVPVRTTVTSTYRPTAIANLRNSTTTTSTYTPPIVSEGTGWYKTPDWQNTGCGWSGGSAASCKQEVCYGGNCVKVGDGYLAIMNSNIFSDAVKKLLIAQMKAFGTNKACIATKSFNCNGCNCDDCGWRQCGPKTATAKGGGGGGGGRGRCSRAAVGAPSLKSPEDNGSVAAGNVALTWSISGWGNDCAGNRNKRFVVYFAEKDEAFDMYSVDGSGSGNYKYSVDVEAGKEYKWKITAGNGITNNTSSTRTFRVEVANIKGYIWNATEASCTDNPPSSKEIKRSDLTDDIKVVADGSVEGKWDPDGFSGYSYEVEDVSYGNKTLCATMPAPKDMPNFKYKLKCLNDSASGVFSDSCVNINVDGNETAHLGFDLFSNGWFHVLDGDVYGGCKDCIDSISMGIPDATAGGFLNYLIRGPGAVFGNSDLSVKDASGNDRYVSDGNKYTLHNLESSFWQKNFLFNAPVNAREVSDCDDMLKGGLDAGKSYDVSRSCMQDALDELSGSYNIDGEGIAVVYVEGDGTALAFTKNVRSSSSDERIIIVTTGNVEIDEDIGSDSPTPSDRAHIEMSIISEESISFLSNGSNDDSTVIIEGPLVTKDGAISFRRDRGLKNDYPAEVVKYNPMYLTKADPAAVAGLKVMDIMWILR